MFLCSVQLANYKLFLKHNFKKLNNLNYIFKKVFVNRLFCNVNNLRAGASSPPMIFPFPKSSFPKCLDFPFTEISKKEKMAKNFILLFDEVNCQHCNPKKLFFAVLLFSIECT